MAERGRSKNRVAAPGHLEHDPEKAYLGLDPGVETGFRKISRP
jgi:hypothetical protein